MLYGKCPYWDCNCRTALGYCQFTACINPNHNQITYTQNTDYKSPKKVYIVTIEEKIE